MSVSFEGELNVANGTASEMLRLLGYKVTEETAGEMPVRLVRERVQAAIPQAAGEIASFLQDLDDIAKRLEVEGCEVLTWF